MRIFCVCLLMLLSGSLYAESIKPFTTDGCSAFPDGTLKHRTLWQACCTAHDYSYWQGGSYQQRIDADRELEQCVTSIGEPEIAKIMLAGVRAGGSPYYPTSFRWGYGWPFPRSYGELSTEELEQVKEQSPSLIHHNNE